MRNRFNREHIVHETEIPKIDRSQQKERNKRSSHNCVNIKSCFHYTFRK